MGGKAAKFPTTQLREGQDKDEDASFNLLMKEMKFLDTKMDNVERHFNTRVDSMQASLEKTIKAELKRSVKEIRENTDLGISIIKSWLDALEGKIQLIIS